MYVNEFEVSDHVAMCDRIEKLLNEEPRREPIVPDEENKKNAGETLCRRPPVLTGDRPAIVSFAKHLTEVANDSCRRPPAILRARPLPAGDPLRENSLCRRPPVLDSTRLLPAGVQSEVFEDGKRPPVDTGDRPSRFLAHFEIDASGCKDGSPPVYTLLPLPAKNDDLEDANEDVQAHTKPNQAIAKKGTSLSPIKLIPFGNEKKKDIQVTNAEEVITLGEEASAIQIGRAHV